MQCNPWISSNCRILEFRNLGQLSINRFSHVIQRWRSENDSTRAQKASCSKKPEEKPIQHHGNEFPILNDLKRGEFYILALETCWHKDQRDVQWNIFSNICFVPKLSEFFCLNSGERSPAHLLAETWPFVRTPCNFNGFSFCFDKNLGKLWSFLDLKASKLIIWAESNKFLAVFEATLKVFA